MGFLDTIVDAVWKRLKPEIDEMQAVAKVELDEWQVIAQQQLDQWRTDAMTSQQEPPANQRLLFVRIPRPIRGQLERHPVLRRFRCDGKLTVCAGSRSADIPPLPGQIRADRAMIGACGSGPPTSQPTAGSCGPGTQPNTSASHTPTAATAGSRSASKPTT